jgi:hypothetical protein
MSPATRHRRPAALLLAALLLSPAAASAIPFWMKLPDGVSTYSDRVDGSSG